MEANPYQAPAAIVADRDLDPGLDVTWGRATKVWWSIIWRAVLFGGLGGMAVGAIAGGFMGAAGVPAHTISAAGSWLGLLVGIPIGIWVIRGVLRKSWSDFRIVLLPVSK